MRKYVTGAVSRLLTGATQGGILNGVDPLEEHLSRFFVQATIILAMCRVLSLVGGYLGQPRVIFEIVGGILLGPSAIGRNAQYLLDIFPKESLSYLQIVADIGLTFYLFLVGLELDPKLLASHAKKAGGIAIIGMVVPFCLGIAISKVMFDVLQGDDPEYKDVPFVSFFVFIGTAMSITAFPVLARILKEGGLIYTKAGAMTMGAAALNDAVAWCLLTLAISIANAGEMSTAGYVFLTVVGFALFLIFAVRPLFERLVEYVEKMHNHTMNSNLFALTICLLFMCAWTTALLGVHAIFGAFLFGLIVPRGSHLFKECNDRIEEFVVNVTLPLYFALSGLKTDVTTIHTGDEGAITILVCVAATVGKFVGAGGTAYFSGMSLRESSVVAVLMNTRGLIELIVLNLGIESGILSIRTFSVMVVMCLFTTFLTNPLVELIYPRAMRAREVEDNDDDSDHHSLNSKKKHVHHSVDGEDIEVEGADTFSRIAVVVESLPHLQSIINLLQYFVPNELDSQLAITAVHFIEPTNSTKDEFLPLNEDGKLIRIDEETTDFAHALNDFEDPSAKKPEILPLSMFCRAMQIPVNAFRIQGDPDEFPIVLKNLCKANDCSFAVIPWRPNSTYVQKLFWSSMNSANTPVALFFSAETLHAHDSESSKDSRIVSDSGSHHHVREPSVRQRGNSVYQRDPVPMYNPDESLESGVQLYSTLPATILPQHRRGTVTNQMNKLRTVGRTASRILALITGRVLDTSMFPVLMRFAENKLNNIVIMVPSDSETFEYGILDAFNSFKTQTASMSNISYNIMEACMNDFQNMYEECKLYDFNLIISSFIEPPCDQATHARPPVAMVSAMGRSARTSSISGALAEAMFSPAEAPTAIPIKYSRSNIKHPELGIIGNMLFEDSSLKSTKVLILHESEKLSISHKMAAATELQMIEEENIDVEVKEGFESEPADQNV